MPPKKARLSAEAAMNNILKFVENDADKKSDEKFDEEDHNYSDLDELFGENCKFRFVVMKQYVISKKRKAKKNIICKLYFLLFYIKHNYYYF